MKKKNKETHSKDEGSGSEAQFTALSFNYEEYAPIQQAGGEEHPIENLQTLDLADVVTSDYSSLKKFTSRSDGPSSPSEKRSQK